MAAAAAVAQSTAQLRALNNVSENIRRLIGQTAFSNTASFEPATQDFIEFLYYIDGLLKYIIRGMEADELFKLLPAPGPRPELVAFLAPYNAMYQLIRQTWMDILFTLGPQAVAGATAVTMEQIDSFIQHLSAAAAVRLGPEDAETIHRVGLRLAYVQIAISKCIPLAFLTRMVALGTDFPPIPFDKRDGTRGQLPPTILQTVRQDSEDLYQGYLTFVQMLQILLIRRQAGGSFVRRGWALWALRAPSRKGKQNRRHRKTKRARQIR